MLNFSKKLAFGLDLSDASLKVLQFKENAGNFFMSSFVKRNIPAGIVKNGVVEKEDKLASIFKKAFIKPNGLPFKGKEVICSLPEEKVFIRVIQLPKMKREELSGAIKWETEAHIPLGIDEVYLGWKIIDPLEDIDHFDILIATTPKYVVDKYVSFLRKINLIPIAFEPESSSVVRSLIKNDDLNPTIIVDLGETGTNFVVFSASAIRFTSHIDISGNFFNQEIMKKMKVSREKANQLKVKFGLINTKEGEKVYKAIDPIISDLTNKIKDYLDFYHSHVAHVHSKKKDISQIILCGGDSHLLKLPETLSSKLNLPVKLGSPLVNITNHSKDQLISKKELLINTTAIGLALRQII